MHFTNSAPPPKCRLNVNFIPLFVFFPSFSCAFKMSLELFQIECYLLHSNFYTSKQHSFKIFRHKTIDWSERKKSHKFSGFSTTFWAGLAVATHTHTHTDATIFKNIFSRINKGNALWLPHQPKSPPPTLHRHGQTHSVTFSSSLVHVFFFHSLSAFFFSSATLTKNDLFLRNPMNTRIGKYKPISQKSKRKSERERESMAFLCSL